MSVFNVVGIVVVCVYVFLFDVLRCVCVNSVMREVCNLRCFSSNSAFLTLL